MLRNNTSDLSFRSLLNLQMLPKVESASTLPPSPQPHPSSPLVPQPIEAVQDGSGLAPSTVSIETEPCSAELMIVCSELSRSFSSEHVKEAVSVIICTLKSAL